jgi:hypothetical protein
VTPSASESSQALSALQAWQEFPVDMTEGRQDAEALVHAVTAMDATAAGDILAEADLPLLALLLALQVAAMTEE